MMLTYSLVWLQVISFSYEIIIFRLSMESNFEQQASGAVLDFTQDDSQEMKRQQRMMKWWGYHGDGDDDDDDDDDNDDDDDDD